MVLPSVVILCRGGGRRGRRRAWMLHYCGMPIRSSQNLRRGAPCCTLDCLRRAEHDIRHRQACAATSHGAARAARLWPRMYARSAARQAPCHVLLRGATREGRRTAFLQRSRLTPVSLLPATRARQRLHHCRATACCRRAAPLTYGGGAKGGRRLLSLLLSAAVGLSNAGR